MVPGRNVSAPFPHQQPVAVDLFVGLKMVPAIGPKNGLVHGDDGISIAATEPGNVLSSSVVLVGLDALKQRSADAIDGFLFMAVLVVLLLTEPNPPGVRR